MEYCNLGDIENYMKKQKEEIFEIEETKFLMFQLFIGLYTSEVLVKNRITISAI